MSCNKDRTDVLSQLGHKWFVSQDKPKNTIYKNTNCKLPLLMKKRHLDQQHPGSSHHVNFHHHVNSKINNKIKNQ